MNPFNLMQNNLEGIHFTLKRTPGFQGKGAGEGGEGKRRRREGQEGREGHEYTLSVYAH